MIDKQNKFICKIASIEDMNEKWDYEIKNAKKDKENWIIWKENNIKNRLEGKIIPYYGILNGKIICEGTASINPNIIQNSSNLVDEYTVYLSVFRTIEKFQGNGYFSQLFKVMIKDLKNRGYKYATIGVEPSEVKNMLIYFNYGFNDYVKTAVETYPNGEKINVNYYSKKLD